MDWRPWLAIVCALVLASCADDSDDSPDEDDGTETRDRDGGQTGGGGGGGPGPTPVDTRDACERTGSHSACDWDEACIDRRCAGVLGRRWAVTDIAVGVGTTDQVGASWDIGGGAPDLQVCFFTEPTAYEGCTAVASDTFSASFRDTIPVTLTDRGVFGFDVLDDDLAEADFVLTYTAESADEMVSLARTYPGPLAFSATSDDRVWLEFVLEPAF